MKAAQAPESLFSGPEDLWRAWIGALDQAWRKDEDESSGDHELPAALLAYKAHGKFQSLARELPMPPRETCPYCVGKSPPPKHYASANHVAAMWGTTPHKLSAARTALRELGIPSLSIMDAIFQSEDTSAWAARVKLLAESWKPLVERITFKRPSKADARDRVNALMALRQAAREARQLPHPPHYLLPDLFSPPAPESFEDRIKRLGAPRASERARFEKFLFAEAMAGRARPAEVSAYVASGWISPASIGDQLLGAYAQSQLPKRMDDADGWRERFDSNIVACANALESSGWTATGWLARFGCAIGRDSLAAFLMAARAIERDRISTTVERAIERDDPDAFMEALRGGLIPLSDESYLHSSLWAPSQNASFASMCYELGAAKCGEALLRALPFGLVPWLLFAQNDRERLPIAAAFAAILLDRFGDGIWPVISAALTEHAEDQFDAAELRSATQALVFGDVTRAGATGKRTKPKRRKTKAKGPRGGL